MAILRGFPPSNTISPTTYVSDLHGEAVVTKNVDLEGKGRVELWPLNEWAEQTYGRFFEGAYPVPPVGTKVTWSAKSYSKTSPIYYDWEEGWKEIHAENMRKAEERFQKWKQEREDKRKRERVERIKSSSRKRKQCF